MGMADSERKEFYASFVPPPEPDPDELELERQRRIAMIEAAGGEVSA